MHKAIREATVNMVIHADYRAEGRIVATTEDWGYTFANPGLPLTPVAEVYAGGLASGRNPILQTMFRMIGYGENIGSGFPLILDTWMKQGWRLPRLSETAAPLRTELKLWMLPMEPPEAEEELQHLIGINEVKVPGARAILMTALIEGDVTIERAARLLMWPQGKARYLIADLEEKGLLTNFGSDTWQLIKSDSKVAVAPPRASAIAELKNSSDRQIMCLVSEKGMITTNDVIKNTSITTRSGATAALRRLKKLELIEAFHRGRSVFYRQRRQET